MNCKHLNEPCCFEAFDARDQASQCQLNVCRVPCAYGVRACVSMCAYVLTAVCVLQINSGHCRFVVRVTVRLWYRPRPTHMLYC